MKVQLAGILCLLLSFSNCSGPVVRSEQASNTDLSKLKTYQWVTQDQFKQLRFDNPNIDYLTNSLRVVQRPERQQKIEGIVDQEMKKVGFQKTYTGTPDFYVTYYVQAEDGDWVSTWQGFTPGANNVPVVVYPGFKQSTAFQYRKGSVILVFYDTQSKSPAWSGTLIGMDIDGSWDEQKAQLAASDLLQQFKKPA